MSEKQAIVGEVVSIRLVRSPLGDQTKMLVQVDDGRRLFGAVPELMPGEMVGRRVAFVADVDQKTDDFGFYSRPTRAKLV